MDMGMDGGLGKNERGPRHFRPRANPQQREHPGQTVERTGRLAIRIPETSIPKVERIPAGADALAADDEREEESSDGSKEPASQKLHASRIGGEISARLSGQEMRATIAREAQKISKEVFQQKAGPHGRTDATFKELFRDADLTERKFKQDIATTLSPENALEGEDIEFLLDMLVTACDRAYRRRGGFIAPREGDRVDLVDFFKNDTVVDEVWNIFTEYVGDHFNGPPVRIETGEAVMDFFRVKFEALHVAAR